MARHRESTVRQLDFNSDHQVTYVGPDDTRQLRPLQPAPVCVVCERHPGRLIFARHCGHASAKLCSHCYHVVMRHPKLLWADFPSSQRSWPTLTVEVAPRVHHVSGDVGLIVSPGSRLSVESRDAMLNHRRRRAQVAARRTLLDCND